MAESEAAAQCLKLEEPRGSGIYVPPAKLEAASQQMRFTKGSIEAQRMYWETLKKKINGLVNKVNVANIRIIILELFKLNLHRGMGLLVRTVMKAQCQSLTFTSIYAALIAALNSKIPQIGELLISRLVLQFRKAFKRDNKTLCLSSTTFLAHLCNQQVCHEIIILEVMHLLLLNPTDDSVDICCGILKHSGLFLSEVCPSASAQLYERLRVVLQEGHVEKRTQYLIEIIFQSRREGFKGYPIVPEGLDLVKEEDQMTHQVRLDDKLKAQDNLNVFAFDEDYDENEKNYAETIASILSDKEEGKAVKDGDSEYGDDVYDNGFQLEVEETAKENSESAMEIKDMTQTNLTNFRKTIYLILKGSMSPDEAVHKILKLGVKPDEQKRVVEMIVQACSQERTYSKYYGVTGEKLSGQSSKWSASFQSNFKECYETIHRLEPNQLRNVSKFWGHMLSCDALGWEALECIKLTEADTTSSGRIFIKFIFQELVEELGIPHLKERLNEDYIQPFISGVFPIEDSQHLQFSINYFTAIGLGILTDSMRERLDLMKKRRINERESERGRRYSRSSSYSRTTSRSRSYSSSRSYSYSRSPSRSQRHYSRTPSRSPRRYSRTPSRSPRRYSRTPSRTPRRYSRTPPRLSSRDSRSRQREGSPPDSDYRDSNRYNRRRNLKDQSEEFEKSGFSSRRTERWRTLNGRST